MQCSSHQPVQYGDGADGGKEVEDKVQRLRQGGVEREEVDGVREGGPGEDGDGDDVPEGQPGQEAVAEDPEGAEAALGLQPNVHWGGARLLRAQQAVLELLQRRVHARQLDARLLFGCEETCGFTKNS